MIDETIGHSMAARLTLANVKAASDAYKDAQVAGLKLEELPTWIAEKILKAIQRAYWRGCADGLSVRKEMEGESAN